MEASSILEKIRGQGFTIKAVGSTISLAPRQRLNDRMIGFIRKHKETILTALYQEQDLSDTLHRERKHSLSQGRLEVLRCLLYHYLKHNQHGDTPTNCKVDKYLDWVLIQHDYGLEKAISTYRNIQPEQKIIDGRCTCGYMPPFCACVSSKD